MSAPITVYLTKHGSLGNAHYGMFPDRKRPPLMDVSVVPSEDQDQKATTLYDPKEPCIFNFCLRGIERWLKIRLPLGSSAEIEMRVVRIVPSALLEGAPRMKTLDERKAKFLAKMEKHKGKGHGHKGTIQPAAAKAAGQDLIENLKAATTIEEAHSLANEAEAHLDDIIAAATD